MFVFGSYKLGVHIIHDNLIIPSFYQAIIILGSYKLVVRIIRVIHENLILPSFSSHHHIWVILAGDS